MDNTNTKPSGFKWRFNPRGEGLLSSQEDLVNYAKHDMLKMLSRDVGQYTIYDFYHPWMLPNKKIASFKKWNDRPFSKEYDVDIDLTTAAEKERNKNINTKYGRRR